jgi:transcriptional regulator with XRE-family HTH domain
MGNKDMAQRANNQLGEYIRERRAVLNMSMRQLEEATGIPRSGLSEIENGLRMAPSPEKLQRIAEALRVDYEDLYAVSGISRPEKLPELDAYLRTRYRDELTPSDRRSLERYFDELRSKKRGGSRGN